MTATGQPLPESSTDRTAQETEPTKEDFETQGLLNNEVTDLQSAREQAKNWLGVVSSLTALVAIVAILKGPEDAADLPTLLRLGIAVAVVLAFLALAYANVALYSAAYGDPGHVTKIRQDPLAGLHLRYQEALTKQATKVPQRLRSGLVAALAGTVLVLGATLSTWFPMPEAAGGAEEETCVMKGEEVLMRLPGGSVEVSQLQAGLQVDPC